MRHHADADDEFAANIRPRQHYMLPRIDPRDQIAVERIEIGARLHQAECHDRKLRLGHDLDALDLVQLLRRPRGESQLLFELLAERLDSEKLERKPDAQSAKV